jgi:HSP20 family protein
MNEQTTLPAERRRTESVALTPLNRLRNEIDQLFDDFGFALPTHSIFSFQPRTAVIPAVELAEVDGGYEVSIELPGLEEKNIDFEVEDGVLSV